MRVDNEMYKFELFDPEQAKTRVPEQKIPMFLPHQIIKIKLFIMMRKIFFAPPNYFENAMKA